MKSLISKLGQLFIIGYSGETPPRPFLNFISEEHIGGVILFEENCSDSTLTTENILSIKQRYSTGLPFIAIDQEGGRVCRLRGVPAEFKSASEYAATRNIERFREDYGRSAVYMESLGINLNLAPVADIAMDNENECLRERCFGSDPELVTDFVRAAVQVSHESGLFSCLKHFPGLGSAVDDPHHKTSVAEYDMLVWEQHERIPFVAGLEEGADMVMTTHLSIPKIDDTIVTGSKKIVDQLLRKNLGFDGPVITDDLTMAGAEPLGNIGERAIAAIQAGHDILLFGQDYEAAFEAYDVLVQAVERGEIDKERLIGSLDRIAGLKLKLERIHSH